MQAGAEDQQQEQEASHAGRIAAWATGGGAARLLRDCHQQATVGRTVGVTPAHHPEPSVSRTALMPTALLATACTRSAKPSDVGPDVGLGGPAGDGSSWWASQTGSGRCARLLPQDGWTAGLDPELVDYDFPYAEIDAGLDAIHDALDGELSFDAVPADLWVEGAIIANVGSSPDSELWFADGFTVIPTVDLTGGVSGARPGDKVRFHVNALKKDYGIDKIAGIDNFSIQESGLPIAVYEPDFSALINDHQSWLNRNIHLVGELVSSQGACGGSATCYDLTASEVQGGATLTLRVSNSAPMAVGACVELIAPLGEFSDAPQFNIAAPGGDGRWIRRFF